MKKKLIGVIIVLIILVSFVFVVFQYQPNSDIIKEELINEKEDTLISVGNHSFNDVVNSFTFNIFKQIIKDNSKNIFLSTYSIFTALAMTYEGARGETASEMADLLNIEQDNTSFHHYVKNLYIEFNKKNKYYNISVANALWTRENLQLIETYANIIKGYYGGDITEIDFNKPEKAAEIINRWIEDNTKGLIKNLIIPEYINSYTMMILANAIYFKGLWKTHFDPVNTSFRDFENSLGETVEASTMSLVKTKNVFNYLETDKIQILELPYAGDSLSMTILLPKDHEISTVIQELNDESLTDWKNSMVGTIVDIYLPKFRVETEYNLNSYLESLGIKFSFTPSANFSGITNQWDLFIDKVLHKAYIDVNEEGTEAAAATSVIVSTIGIEEPNRLVFDCNHPFIYIIQHNETDTILFIGIINDPSY